MNTQTSQLSFVMTDKEKELLLTHVSQAKQYVEFGGGGSTVFILQKTQAAITLVESSTTWIEHMRSFSEISEAEKSGRLNINLIDIGPTGDWGRPIDASGYKRYPEYSSAVFTTKNSKNIDVVFVDGRFRVACALAAALHCSNHKIPILVHDFSIRPEYHVLLEYMDIVSSADTLVVLQVKPDVELSALQAAYEKYKYIYA